MSEHNFLCNGLWWKASWNSWDNTLNIWENEDKPRRINLRIEKKDILEIARIIKREMNLKAGCE